MQVKKEMKHAVAIGLFIESWNPLPMHPLLPAPYVLQIPLSSELQTNPNTIYFCITDRPLQIPAFLLFTSCASLTLTRYVITFLALGIQFCE